MREKNTVRNLKALCMSLVLAFAVIAPSGINAGDGELTSGTSPPGQPGYWPQIDAYPCCMPIAAPDSGVYNGMNTFRLWVTYGYPLHGNLFVGLNDTFSVLMHVENSGSKDFSLTGIDLGKSFSASAYRIGDTSELSVPWRDSLGVRLRQWCWDGMFTSPAPAKIPAHKGAVASIILDVWNLPVGTYCVCIDSSKSVASGFTARKFSWFFEYQVAQSLADSTNAYEGCYWRMIKDSNFLAAKGYANKILAMNPKSVPGWWLMARYYLFVKDANGAKAALDSAIVSMNTSTDPALPDSTKRGLFPEEVDYLNWNNYELAAWRENLGP